MILSVERLSVAFGGTDALHEASFSIAAGEVVALLGANGAGKTTLLRALMGLVPTRGGGIVFDGADISAAPPERRARRGLGYVPEGRRVFAGMTVRDNLLVACRAPAAERARRLDAVHALFPQLGERPATLAWSLSGGQQQMLAIGRALMTGPRLLLLDEPSLGLAPKLAAEVLARLGAIAAEGTAILLAEQNVAGALRVATRGGVLQLGRLVREASSAELASDPMVREAFLGGTIAP